MDGLILVRLDEPYPVGMGKRIDLKTGALVDYQPPSPGDDEMQTWAWSEEHRQWLPSPTLAAIKAVAWAAIKDRREALLVGAFTVAGRTFQCNQASMSGATLGAFMALTQGGDAAANYRQSWVLADNTTVSLTAAEMVEVGWAGSAYVTELWEKSQRLRQALDAATTIDAVEAVKWDAAAAQIARDAKETS